MEINFNIGDTGTHLASLFGGITIAGLVIKTIELVTGIQAPDVFVLVLDAIRYLMGFLWNPFFDFTGLASWITVKFGEQFVQLAKDYFTAGFVVAGMRYRSGSHVWKSLKDGELPNYVQRVFLLLPVTVHAGQPLRWFFLTLYRLAEAFFLWWYRLVGSTLRFIDGSWEYMDGEQITDPVALSARRKQYLVFFLTFVYAFSFLALILMFIFFEDLTR